MFTKQVLRLVPLAVMLVASLWLTTSPAQAGVEPPAAGQVAQVDSPSPTLGSTPQQNPEQQGDNDGDPADFSQVPWALLIVLALGLSVAASLAFYLIRRARGQHRDKTDLPADRR